MSLSPGHLAVEQEDLPRLRELLDGGYDVEDDSGDGWTLLRHAIDVEIDGHVQSGEALHVDVTAFLLARGADPLRASMASCPPPKRKHADTGWPPTSSEPGRPCELEPDSEPTSRTSHPGQSRLATGQDRVSEHTGEHVG